MSLSLVFNMIVVPALLTLAWAWWFVLRARRSTGWPVVAATITESRVVQQGNARSPRVAFDYLAGAQRHVGNRLWVGPRSIAVTGKWADRVAARYPVGAVVRVAVDPADPAYAVLEPGIQALHWLPLVFGLAMVVVGTVVAAAG
jgi:hypothetical protein